MTDAQRPSANAALPSAPSARAADPTSGDDTPVVEPVQTVLHMPVDNRSLSMALLAIFGAIVMLHWASAVLIPVMLALTFSYALAPAVDRLQALRMPRALAAALLLGALVGATGWTAYRLSDEATAFVEELPAAAQRIRQSVRALQRRPDTAIDKVQAAATQLEQAAKEGSAGPSASERGVTRVQIEPARFSVQDYLWTSAPGMAASIGQAVAVLFITFFLLSSGDSFRRKMVRLAGPTFARRKLTVQALDEITEQIQRYLLVQVLISVLVGVATWLGFLAIGVEHAAVWGVLAFALNFIPYLGSVALSGASALAAFVQFGSIDMAVLVAGASLAIHTVAGNLLAPWLTSRASRLNAVSVFIGVLAFGWLWGVWGLVLGVPILMMVKAISDRVDDLKPLGEMLGT
jgi:predicted PurR-regulated permease PerM